jgi:hypothetical protein
VVPRRDVRNGYQWKDKVLDVKDYELQFFIEILKIGVNVEFLNKVLEVKLNEKLSPGEFRDADGWVLRFLVPEVVEPVLRTLCTITPSLVAELSNIV